MNKILAIAVLLMVLALPALAVDNGTTTYSNIRFDGITVTNPVQGSCNWVRIYLDVPPLTMTNVAVTVLNNQLFIRPTEHRYIVYTQYTNTAAGAVKRLAVTNVAHAYVSCGNSGSTSSNTLIFTTMGAPYFDVAVTNNFATRINVNVCGP